MSFLQRLIKDLDPDPLSKLAPEAQKAVEWVVGQSESRGLFRDCPENEKSSSLKDAIDREKKTFAKLRQIHARIPALLEADMQRYRANSNGVLEHQAGVIVMGFNWISGRERPTSSLYIGKMASAFLADTSRTTDHSPLEKKRAALAALLEQLPDAVRQVAQHRDVLFAAEPAKLRAQIRENLTETNLRWYGHFAKAASRLVMERPQGVHGRTLYLTDAEIVEQANRIVQDAVPSLVPGQRRSSRSR